MAVKTLETPFQERRKASSLWNIALRRLLKKPKAVFAIGVLVIIYGSGVFANLIAPYDYTDQNLAAVRQPPSVEHWLGTDWVGRDMFTRLVFALRSNLILTVTSMLTGSLVLGVSLGLVAGYFGKLADSIISRIGEVFIAFPGILLTILIVATIKPRVLEWVRGLQDATGFDGLIRWGVADYLVVFTALSAFSWVGMSRLVRGQTLYLKESQYVEAARAMGASTKRILFIHLLPNALPPVIVSVTMGIGGIAGAEVVLSWLGIGIQPPVPSLGKMIFEGQSITILRNFPHLLLPPVLVVAALIFAWNLLGDALNDVLNPRAR
jgi:ABC-type dipeptide/oligopeptide/nickel transport system permease subunit